MYKYYLFETLPSVLLIICPEVELMDHLANLASQVVLVVKNLPANTRDVRDLGSIPGLGRSPGGGHGNLLQNFCLENPMDWGAWWANAWQICLIFEEPPYCFQEQLHHFTSQPALHKGSYFPTFSQHVLFSGVLIVAISMGVRWYLVMVWFAFCWWTVMLSIFSWTYWSFINLLWRNVYLRPLLTF